MIKVTWDASRLETKLEGITSGLGDMRPIWKDVHDVFIGFMKRVFRSQGAYAASKWVPLNPAYAAWKRRKYGNKPILQREGTLLASFTEKTHSDHVARIGPSFAEFGTRVRYAKAHQYGIPARRLPARPMITEVTKAEGEQIADIILAFILRKARRGR